MWQLSLIYLRVRCNPNVMRIQLNSCRSSGLVAIVILVSLITFPTRSVGQRAPVYDFRPEDRQYLEYFRIYNGFDSSETSYMMGELSVEGDSAHFRVYLDTLVPLEHSLDTDSALGESGLIFDSARSRTFLIPHHAHFSFFRQFRNWNYRWSAGISDSELASRQWPWDLEDSSEFVLQLVRASNSAVLAVLDSVGTPRSVGTFPAERRYGTAPANPLRTCSLPDSIAGITAFVRVSARRRGSSPLGMSLLRMQTSLNWSAIYDSSDRAVLSPSQADSLDRNVKFPLLIAYADSLRQAACELPRGFSLADSMQMDSFLTRYCDRLEDSIGNGWYEDKTCDSAMGKVHYRTIRPGTPPLGGRIGLQAYPNPFTLRTRLVYSIPVEDASSVTDVSVFDMMGRNVTSLVHDVQTAGPHSVTFDGGDLPMGQYAVRIRTNSRLEQVMIHRAR